MSFRNWTIRRLILLSLLVSKQNGDWTLLTQTRLRFVNTNLTTLVLLIDNGSLMLLQKWNYVSKNISTYRLVPENLLKDFAAIFFKGFADPVLICLNRKMNYYWVAVYKFNFKIERKYKCYPARDLILVPQKMGRAIKSALNPICHS